MAVTNFLVSSLPAYVQTNRDIIIKSFALVGTDTRRRIGLQTGIKKSAYLNYLDFRPTLQDGSSCGFEPLDEIEISQREIETATYKVDGEICPETLLGKYAEYLVRVAATENELPFEQYIVDGIVAQVNKEIERLIWVALSAGSGGTDLFDGFLAQMSADGQVIEETLERGGVIFVSPAIYRLFLQKLVSLNLYHYSGPQDARPNEFVFPGSDVLVVNTPGLANSLNIVGTFADNLVYGTDGENDSELVDLWWSQDARKFRYQIKWNMGVAYHFPAQVVFGTFAAAPTA